MEIHWNVPVISGCLYLWLFLTFCSLVFSKCSTMNMYYFCNQKKLTRVIWKYASSFRKTVLLFSSWLAKMFSIVKVLVWRRLQQTDSNKYLLSAGGMEAAVLGIAGIQHTGYKPQRWASQAPCPPEKSLSQDPSWEVMVTV